MVLYDVYCASFETAGYSYKRQYIGYTGNQSRRWDKLKLGGTFWCSCMKKETFDLKVVVADVPDRRTNQIA